MNQSKSVLIVGRKHENPERTFEVVCLNDPLSNVNNYKMQSNVLWIDTAQQIQAQRSGVKSFDHIAENDYLGTGNVVGGLQFSSCFRPRTQILCNGHERERGVLQGFDLKGLRDARLDVVANKIKRHIQFEECGGHWYLFRRYSGVIRIVYGVLVTDAAHNLVFRFDREDLGCSATGAARRILDAMELRVTSKAWQERTRVFERNVA